MVEIFSTMTVCNTFKNFPVSHSVPPRYTVSYLWTVKISIDTLCIYGHNLLLAPTKGAANAIA